MVREPDAWLADEVADDVTDVMAAYVRDEIVYRQSEEYESDLKAFVDDVAPVELAADRQHYRGVYDIEASRLYDVLTTAVEQCDDDAFLESIGERVGDGVIQAFREERRNRLSGTRYRFEGDNVDRTIINGLAETVAANVIAQELREDYSEVEGIDSLVSGLWRNPGNV
ncbi:MAG: hypothetical protein SVU32_05130 [Candidatus Nanohaloarchaea archaeon]|nr:hypothetical protein [Candidatus Nanohaloarchaea archaeon]